VRVGTVTTPVESFDQLQQAQQHNQQQQPHHPTPTGTRTQLDEPFIEKEHTEGVQQSSSAETASSSSSSSSSVPRFDPIAYTRRNPSRPVIVEIVTEEHDEHCEHHHRTGQSYPSTTSSLTRSDHQLLSAAPAAHSSSFNFSPPAPARVALLGMSDSSSQIFISDDPAQNEGLDTERYKLHQAWPGHNRPILGGRVLCGPDHGVLTFHLCLMLGASILFDVFVASRIHVGVVVGCVVLNLFTLYCLAKATWTEAGILPRASLQKLQSQYDSLPIVPDDVYTSVPQATERRDGMDVVRASSPEVTSQPMHIDRESGERVSLRYCTTCKIYRPPRTKHCRDCDNCVEEFDHHCPWVCNCIGRRNYRYFVAFVMSVTMLTGYVFICSIYLVISKAQDLGFSGAVADQPLAGVLTLFTFMLGWCLCSLSCYHLWLIGQGMTTNEHIKMQRSELEMPIPPRVAAGGGGSGGRARLPGGRHGTSTGASVRSTDELDAMENGRAGSATPGSSNFDYARASDDQDDLRKKSSHTPNCCNHVYTFFCRPSVASYFDLQAPLNRCVFIRTYIPASGSAAAQRAQEQQILPVAMPVVRRSHGNMQMVYQHRDAAHVAGSTSSAPSSSSMPAQHPSSLGLGAVATTPQGQGQSRSSDALLQTQGQGQGSVPLATLPIPPPSASASQTRASPSNSIAAPSLITDPLPPQQQARKESSTDDVNDDDYEEEEDMDAERSPMAPSVPSVQTSQQHRL